MIQVSKTARRYAQALFQLAAENPRAKVENTFKDVLSVRRDLEAAGETVREAFGGRTVLEALKSQEFDVDFKKALLHKIIDEHKYQKTVVNFYGVLLEMNQFVLLDEILLGFEEEMNRAANRVKAFVTSATPLTDEQKAQLKEKVQALTGKESLLVVQENADLIGGVRVEVEGKVYDFSLRAQLQRLCQQLVP